MGRISDRIGSIMRYRSLRSVQIQQLHAQNVVFPKLEALPTEVCQIRYECTNCGVALYPEGDDCCVFCTYGDFECPSIQEGKVCCETE